MYLVCVPLEKTLAAEYNALVVSFCSRFKKNISCSLESFLFLTCDKMPTSCLHCVAHPQRNSVWNFDLVVILHGAPASSRNSHPPQSTQESLSTVSTSTLCGDEWESASASLAKALCLKIMMLFGYFYSSLSFQILSVLGFITLQECWENLFHKWNQVAHLVFRFLHL